MQTGFVGGGRGSEYTLWELERKRGREKENEEIEGKGERERESEIERNISYLLMYNK